MNFAEKLCIGGVGEKIVESILNDRGLIVYPSPKNKRHLVDYVCYEPGKFRFFGVEVKTKVRRAFSEDTGINTYQYQKYIRLLDQMDTILFFVDHWEGAIYYQKISVLARSYPPQGDISYFLLSSMIYEKKLLRAEVFAIRSQCDFDPFLYKDTPRFF